MFDVEGVGSGMVRYMFLADWWGHVECEGWRAFGYMLTFVAPN
jgi:hypothetical protein